MNIHRRPRLAKYRTLSNALLFVRRSLSRLFAISIRNSIDTQQRLKWKMDWYRPGQQTLNHITLIKVIICIYIYTRHSTIMSFDSTDVRFTCTNRRKNENHFHVFVQQQFSHFSQHNSCVRQSAIFAFIFFAKKEDWAHTHTSKTVQVYLNCSLSFFFCQITLKIPNDDCVEKTDGIIHSQMANYIL